MWNSSFRNRIEYLMIGNMNHRMTEYELSFQQMKLNPYSRRKLEIKYFAPYEFPMYKEISDFFL